MHRRHFEYELERLVRGAVAFGWEVESSFALMVQVLADHDTRVAARQMGDDAKFKSWAAGLDRECLLLQARQAPVGRDLRLLHAARTASYHLARSGTLCDYILGMIVETPGERDGGLDGVIMRMARSTHKLFQEGLIAFEQRDPDRAWGLRSADDEVDLLYEEVVSLISHTSAAEAALQGWRVRVPLVAHYLERIADRGVEVGELAIFVAKGERVSSMVGQQRYLGG